MHVKVNIMKITAKYIQYGKKFRLKKRLPPSNGGGQNYRRKLPRGKAETSGGGELPRARRDRLKEPQMQPAPELP